MVFGMKILLLDAIPGCHTF